MKIFKSSRLGDAVEVNSQALENLGVNDAPYEITESGSRVGYIKIDDARVYSGAGILRGWCSNPDEIELFQSGEPLEFHLTRELREDVNQFLGKNHEKKLGFKLLIPFLDEESDVELVVVVGSRKKSFRVSMSSFAASERQSDSSQVKKDFSFIMMREKPFTESWLMGISNIEPMTSHSVHAAGWLESTLYIPEMESCLVAGWVVLENQGVAWLEDEYGNIYPLDHAVWQERSDVKKSVSRDLQPFADAPGFFVRLDLKDELVKKLTLKTLTYEGLHVIASMDLKNSAESPKEIAEWIFGIPLPRENVWTFFNEFSEPILSKAIKISQKKWPSLKVVEKQFCKKIDFPEVSLVIPLYGRFDFVESQLFEFSRDSWLREKVEIIYVVDDPAIFNAFIDNAAELSEVYRVPFTVLFGDTNRGFSGANNLGALHARAGYLLFLNSDAFPQAPGWIGDLLAVLEKNPEVGVVGPRLLFSEGGIQHAGMDFQYSDKFDVWLNIHPYMGLEPHLDPNEGLVIVPAVTGACMLVRKKDFYAVGGWDTGYFIGDFEDSDLCLKLRSYGLKCAYFPEVQLTHLERQSFSSLGSGGFRQEVVLWNARRHQQRWGNILMETL